MEGNPMETPRTTSTRLWGVSRSTFVAQTSADEVRDNVSSTLYLLLQGIFPR